MLEVRESVVFSALALILVSIPAASQNVEVTQEDSYSAVIDSEFSDRFKIEFETGKMLMEATDSDASLQVNQSFRRKTVRLQTSEGTLERVETNDSIVRTVQTPFGRFESGVRNGENFSEFEGGDEERASEIRERLEERMEERMSAAREKRQVAVSEILPDVELEVETDNEREHFNLTNNMGEDVDLEGWQVLSEDEHSYTHELEGTLEPGETRVYHTNDRDEVRDYPNSVYGTGLTIYSGNGRVALFNPEEMIVDAVEY